MVRRVRRGVGRGSPASWSTPGPWSGWTRTKKPNSFWCASDPSDVARVEDRTFICSRDEADAGATNNWMAPDEMKSVMTDLYRGCMRGRTMYVIPFCMGPLEAESPMFGVEITDSAYVVCSMRIMARMGSKVLERMGRRRRDFVPCLHSVGAPLEPGQQDVPWPCSDTKYITQFPEERMIWSFGSGYGGNALLGKKCFSLRIASVMGRDEGWLAEHMLILKLTSPEQAVHYVAAAFPSACGKTNLAMLEPTIEGWKVETLGDDIAWMRFGEDGRLYALNPEFGLFGVAPGTGWNTNPNAMRTIAKGNSMFTNVALTDDGDIWWEGMTEEPPAHLTDWKGRDWTPDSRRAELAPQLAVLHADHAVPDHRAGVRRPAAACRSRRSCSAAGARRPSRWSTRPATGCTASSWAPRCRPRRRPRRPARSASCAATRWRCCRSSATTPATTSGTGSRWARRPTHVKLPKIFYVNWFRRDDDGSFLWPGYGENGRVLKWVIERIEGRAAAVETADRAGPDARLAGRRRAWT